MISKSLLNHISGIVGKKYLLTTENEMVEFATDATKISHMPDIVAFPENSQQISRILKLATETGFPVVPRGAGTGMSGGAIPVRGGVVLAMDRLNRIISVDRDNLIAKVEPGVITAHLQQAVESLGLFYPPDPASLKVSTLGGNIAECAGGLRAVKYGVTRDYVLGLTIVLPTGEIIKTGVETRKGVAGYDLVRLIAGSEGTLAVITAMTLRLVPKPETKRTMVAFFENVPLAVQTVSEIIRNKIVPAILEFMDRLCIDCVREEMHLDLPKNSGAMLLIEVDGTPELVAHQARIVEDLCRQCGAMAFKAAKDHESAEALWEARRNVSPSLQKLRPHKINEDIVVPRSRLAELVSFLETVSMEYDLPIPAFGHAGDGNIHVNIMLDKEDPVQLKNGHTIVKALFQKVIDMGGTITGEHGIGITKAPYLEMEIPLEGIQLMMRIKKAFDPKGILNPGKIFHRDL
ncbi:MAG: glycolate oxidase subunit GlcD [Desulfobacteraceae bacterium 4572_87]|nr:MAG: glycolate oxidase subunit GlcD [Desulfobacteraceae bacterium 4572_87]